MVDKRPCGCRWHESPERVHTLVPCPEHTVVDELAENDRLRERIAQLEEALRFYADPHTYAVCNVYINGKLQETLANDQDEKGSGKRARQALDDKESSDGE